MQMRQGLAHGKGGLVKIELALEQNRQALVRAQGLDLAGGQHIGQAVLVVRLQLRNARVQAFAKQLQDAGLVTTVRKTRGDDIDAACGQLAGDVKDRTQVQSRMAEQRTISLVPLSAVTFSETRHDTKPQI